MNINDLTLGQAKELAALLNGASLPQACLNSHPMIGRHCLIRTYSSGVHFGIVKQVDNKANAQGSDILLEKARRIWKWEGAFTLSEVSQNGVDKSSRIALEVPEIFLTGVIEIIPTTEEARKTFGKCNEK